jgi:hypothetical protein
MMTSLGALVLAFSTLVVAAVSAWKARRQRTAYDAASEFASSLRGLGTPQHPEVRGLPLAWFVMDEGAEDFVHRLCAGLQQEFELRAFRIRPGRTLRESAVELRNQVAQDLGHRGARRVLFGEGSGIPVLMQVLLDEPVLRDQMWACVALGPGIRGREDIWPEQVAEDWLQANFRGSVLDTEMHRPTLYASLGWPSAHRSGQDPSFPSPPEEESPSWIETTALGVLSERELADPSLVARSLAAALRGWCAARG